MDGLGRFQTVLGGHGRFWAFLGGSGGLKAAEDDGLQGVQGGEATGLVDRAGGRGWRTGLATRLADGAGDGAGDGLADGDETGLANVGAMGLAYGAGRLQGGGEGTRQVER
ncbi:unnamed protein product [Closterium sp. Naga37s-1]|nr:unnamed protein product [Closterium sp. Naga37s-1]